MADKKVMFKFRDGLKEIAVGDKVLYVSGDRREHNSEMFITRIGRKLITVGYNPEYSDWGRTEFYIEDGYMKSEYTGRGSLYSSKEAYERCKLESQTIEQVVSRFRSYNNDWLSYDKAVRIKAILEEDGPEQKKS